MLIDVIYEGRKLNFVNPKNASSDSNVFTVVTGKNGTGKSRLLSAVVSEFLRNISPNSKSQATLFPKITLNPSYQPAKIISVSTSPFDKFPLPRNKRPIPNYTYLGLREISSTDFGLGYLAKIIGSLIEVIQTQPSQLSGIFDVLRYLDYSERIQIQLQVRVSKYLTDQMHSAKKFIEFLERYPRGPRIPFSSFNWDFFRNEDGTVSKRKVDQVVKAMKRNSDFIKQFRSIHTLLIDQIGIQMDGVSGDILNDLPFFLQIGIVRLRKMVLSKYNTAESFSISDASSGEQSVLMSILGIASQIADNSLICIDEPEVCLHPEWQERYIRLLVSTFQKYSGCHFLIATHSPQIVSNLDAENSFILSMESGKTISAQRIIRHSSDFQLANVFDSPGFKNEYLTRIAISTFTKVAKNKTFDQLDKQNFSVLTKNSKHLEQSDPVFDLYSAIKDLYKLYG